MKGTSKINKLLLKAFLSDLLTINHDLYNKYSDHILYNFKSYLLPVAHPYKTKTDGSPPITLHKTADVTCTLGGMV